jgi:hypothetical protein
VGEIIPEWWATSSGISTEAIVIDDLWKIPLDRLAFCWPLPIHESARAA